MLKQALVAALALAAMATGAAAQEKPLGALFITPMGEPFRSSDPAVRPIQVWFNQKDTDHDGKLSMSEYLTDAMAFFAVLDRNGDGVVTSLETTSYWERNTPEILTEWSSDRGFEGVRRDASTDDERDAQRQTRHQQEAQDRVLRGAARYGLINVLEPVMSCDTNFDRRVTRDEFQACAVARFSQIDTNHDGFFQLSEAPTRFTAPRD
ncbi:MAG: hypothetical protein ABUL73_03960 [Alphaproteobacteria bacterium]